MISWIYFSNKLRKLAEGCFFINLHKVTDRKLNERVKLGFKLTQHIRDEQLMKSLIELLGCGNLFSFIPIPRQGYGN